MDWVSKIPLSCVLCFLIASWPERFEALCSRSLALLEGVAFVHLLDDGSEYLAKFPKDYYPSYVDTANRAIKAALEQYACTTR